MTEEEYFRKNYPDSCYGDKPLSPHWDFFQDGVEFGERQSEKRIEELEKEIAELLCQKNRNKSCYSCANATEKCFKNEIGCPCQNYKSYKEENAELKNACDETQELLDKQIEITYKLNKENAELKEQNIKDCENFNKTMREIKEQWNKEHYQLIKAKEIIKTLVADLSMYSGDYQKELLEAKQFLKLDNDEIYEHIQKAKYNYIN